MRHELKTDPRPFAAVWDGTKLYEIRKDDRERGDLHMGMPTTGFQVDDELLLRETEFSGVQMKGGRRMEYTGREVLSVVTHKLTGASGYGIQEGWCILGIKRLELINRKGPHDGAHYRPDQPESFINRMPSPSAAGIGTVVGEGVKTRDPALKQAEVGLGAVMPRVPGWSVKQPPEHWVVRFGMAEAVARMHSTSPLFCMGANCFSDGTTSHSLECVAEHEATTNPGGKYTKDFESNKTAIALAVAWDGEGMPYCFAHGRNTHVMDCRTCEVSLHARCSMETERRKKDVPVAVDRRIDAKQMSNKSGGHVSYYSVDVDNPGKGGAPYRAEAIDVIASLDMTFAEGEAFKAVWRCAADRCGAHKDGNDTRRDAEKVAYYGEQMTAREKKRHG